MHRIRHGNRLLHVVMVHSSVAFLNMSAGTLRMPLFIDPRSFIETRRVDDEVIVIFPVAYREPVVASIGSTLLVDILGKFSAVRPDFTKHPLLLISNQDAVRRRSKQHATAHADGMSLQIPRSSQGVTGNKGVIRRRKAFLKLGAVRQLGVPALDYGLAHTSHGSYRT